MGLSKIFNDEKLKDIYRVNSTIQDMSDDEIGEKISLLSALDFNDDDISDIIYQNPMYLVNDPYDVVNTINLLIFYGFDINSLIISNPFILNLDYKDIEKYIKGLVDDSGDVKEVINNLEMNPLIFLEI